MPKAKSCGIFWKRYKADHEGLELVWFVDVQRGLDNYISILGVAANEAKVRAAFQSRLERLASALERYAAQPTTADAEVINQTLNWLHVARQRRTWFHAVDRSLVQPNVYGSISADDGGGRLRRADQRDDADPGLYPRHRGYHLRIPWAKPTRCCGPTDDAGIIDTLFCGIAIGQQRGLSSSRDDLQQLDHGAFRLQTAVDHPGWTLVTSFDRLRRAAYRGAGHPTLQGPPDDRAAWPGGGPESNTPKPSASLPVMPSSG